MLKKKKEPAVGDKRKADIWHNFDVIRDEKTQKIIKSICKFCFGPLKVTTKGVRIKIKNQQKISVFKSSQSETNTTTISNWEFNQTSTRLALAKMIVIDEQPFSYVERDRVEWKERISMSRPAVDPVEPPPLIDGRTDVAPPRRLRMKDVQGMPGMSTGLARVSMAALAEAACSREEAPIKECKFQTDFVFPHKVTVQTQDTKIGSSSSEQFRAVPMPVPKIRELLLAVPVPVPKTKELTVPVPIPEKIYLPIFIPNLYYTIL
ncbi:hypothetical protein LXL04_034246 [Taraxacum kok-saghyz]